MNNYTPTNLQEMDKYLETYNLPRLNYDKIKKSEKND